ncbi:MAG: hypothetical protein RLZZ165_1739 [Bacteroidota bacterium]|jgi:hypothetical protein
MNSVARRNVLDFDPDQHIAVIGIASNDMVWRLCWKLNQALGINLATAEDDLAQTRVPILYADDESDPEFDYIFFENVLKRSQGTKLATTFRFWLVVKGKKDRRAETDALVRVISEIDIVSMALNLTDEKDIKKLLP